jgi:sterol desaturase/sphingolipid hydroxylase (fatty acid hydroxylase superfamily)
LERGDVNTMAADPSGLRFGAFMAVLVAMAAWELIAPWRWGSLRAGRWSGNLGIAIIGAVLTRAVTPLAPLAAAITAEANGWGLLHWLAVPAIPAAIVGFLMLDLVIYAQHRAFHIVPAAWPIHRMHHADISLDVTTGLRFHPVEILLSLVIKTGAVFALGPAPGVVVAFEMALNATSMFNHGNVRVPPAVDRWLRWLVVTPDMHRVHHSTVRAETDSNFGFNIPWWDRLFGTYVAAPAAGTDGMTIGLASFRSKDDQSLSRLLAHPWLAER